MNTTNTWALTDRRYTKYRFSDEIRNRISSLKPDNWHGLIALLEDYIVIMLSIAACYGISWWLYPISILVIGARQRGLSTILHDSAHGVCAKNRRLNKLLGTWLTAYPIFQRYYAYRLSHVQKHHTYLGDPKRDPDLQFFIEQGVYEPTKRWRYLAKILILPLLGSRTLAYLRYLIRYRYLHIMGSSKRVESGRVLWKVRVDNASFFVFWIAVGVITYATNTVLDLFLFWIVPYATAFHILGWFIELSEHTPYIATQEVDLHMTRNRKSRGLERFLTGIHNDHHHLDHHLDTRTPFWLLPKAREIRMQDPNYARVDRETGGLFTRSLDGAPSAISRILSNHIHDDERQASSANARL